MLSTSKSSNWKFHRVERAKLENMEKSVAHLKGRKGTTTGEDDSTYALPSHFGSNRAQNKPRAVSHEIPHFPKIARNRIRGEEGRLSLLKGDWTGIGQRLPRLFCRRFNTHRQDSSGQWVSWEVDAISRDGLTVGVVWACALTWALNGDR